MSRWIVSVKGIPNSPGYEISVVKEDNEHGRHAYGFFGPDKISIVHGNVCERGLDQEGWDEAVKAAHRIKAQFNGEF